MPAGPTGSQLKCWLLATSFIKEIGSMGGPIVGAFGCRSQQIFDGVHGGLFKGFKPKLSKTNHPLIYITELN